MTLSRRRPRQPTRLLPWSTPGCGVGVVPDPATGRVVRTAGCSSGTRPFSTSTRSCRPDSSTCDAGPGRRGAGTLVWIRIRETPTAPRSGHHPDSATPAGRTPCRATLRTFQKPQHRSTRPERYERTPTRRVQVVNADQLVELDGHVPCNFRIRQRGLLRFQGWMSPRCRPCRISSVPPQRLAVEKSGNCLIVRSRSHPIVGRSPRWVVEHFAPC